MFTFSNAMIALNTVLFAGFAGGLGYYAGQGETDTRLAAAQEISAHAYDTQTNTLSGMLIAASVNVDPDLDRFQTAVVHRPAPKPLVKMFEYSDDQLCMAFALFHEARGEPREGQILAGLVTKNRVGLSGWENVCDVVFAPSQYSFTLEHPYIDMSDPVERQSFREALDLSRDLTMGAIPDISRNATHYYNPAKVTPHWEPAFQEVAFVQGHRFMRCSKEGSFWC